MTTNNTNNQSPVPVQELPDDQREILTLYEEAFKLPDGSTQEHDFRAGELEATNDLAEQMLHDLALSGRLRQTAYDRVQQAKERQQALNSAPADVDRLKDTHEKTSHTRQKLPVLKEEVAWRVLERMGVAIDTEGGKGNHRKAFNPETEMTATLHSKRGSVNPIPLSDMLKKLGISREDFLAHL